MPKVQHLIVIGGSAGGLQPLLQLIPSFSADLDVAICVVIHLSPNSKSMLPQLLSRASNLEASYPEDGEVLSRGHIYVAPPGLHMVIEGDRLRLNHDPAENMSRPAIDPLFRSAAKSMGTGVIGIILSGSLDDGTAGLLAIKDGGGLTIVQAPHDTAFSSMPDNAIARVKVDMILGADQIGPKVVEICRSATGQKVQSQFND